MDILISFVTQPSGPPSTSMRYRANLSRTEDVIVTARAYHDGELVGSSSIAPIPDPETGEMLADMEIQFSRSVPAGAKIDLSVTCSATA